MPCFKLSDVPLALQLVLQCLGGTPATPKGSPSISFPLPPTFAMNSLLHSGFTVALFGF